MRIGIAVLGLWLVMTAVAGAQEPPPEDFVVDSFPSTPSHDSGFTALFWLLVPLSLLGAFITLRRDWNAGTFFGRSRVDLSNDPNERPDLPIPTALTPAGAVKTPEARLAEIARLKERGVITEEEHAKLRADVLADIADG